MMLLLFSLTAFGKSQDIRCFDTIQQKKILQSIFNEKHLKSIVIIQDSLIIDLKKIIDKKENIIVGLENKCTSYDFQVAYQHKLINEISKEANDLRKKNNKLEKKAKQRKYWFSAGLIGGFLIAMLI